MNLSDSCGQSRGVRNAKTLSENGFGKGSGNPLEIRTGSGSDRVDYNDDCGAMNDEPSLFPFIVHRSFLIV